MNNILIHKTNLRPQPKNLDIFPIIDRSLIDYDRYHKFVGHSGVKCQMAIQAARGCPYQCFYCDVYKTYQHHSRRSVEHIFNEVKLLADIGVKRIEFIDDIFNVNKKDFVAFFELVLKHRLDLKFFFPTGLRGDLLSKDIIDLMVEAGTIMLQLSLESASPRLQKIMRKNLNIEKFHENVLYITEKYPFVVLGLNAMHGFPTETEEEALMTLDFIKSIKWAHFPYLFNVIIFPGTELEQFALEQGLSKEAIEQSQDIPFEDIPPTLPFSQGFTKNVRMTFVKEYVLNKERLLHVLPHQMKLFSEDELNQKYNGYFFGKIKSLNDLLKLTKINRSELTIGTCLDERQISNPDLKIHIREKFPQAEKQNKNALRLMLIDLSTFFLRDLGAREYNVLEPPQGLLALLTYINQEFGDRVEGRIYKSRVDFNSYEELHNIIEGFSPDIIGIRTLTLYKDFFHDAVSYIRNHGISTPIIAGGPYASASYAELLQDKNVCLAVIGEGEITLAEIIEKTLSNNNCLPGAEVLKNIPGIAFIEDTMGSLNA